MTAPGEDDGRTMNEDGTQKEGEMATGGASGAGPTFSTGGDQVAGGDVPPYEGRKEKAESDQEGGTHRDGARVGGATGPVDDPDFKAPSPSDTPGGRTASPGDEQPASEMSESAPDEGSDDSTSHVGGTPKGEKGGS